MPLSGTENYDIKVFQIDTSFYQFHGMSSLDEIVQFIVDYHRERVDDTDNIRQPVFNVDFDETRYYIYVYNEDERDSHWKSFLPESIASHLDFTIQKISFALFGIVGQNIFAVVGGGGIRVIKRFINHRFGLEFYEYLTDLSEEINSITVRGISGKLAEKGETFRVGQKLIDTINFTNIPSKINLIMREDLKNSLFDFIDFDDRNVFIEIGAYFHIKHKISFNSLHILFDRMNTAIRDGIRTSLTSFIQIKEKHLTDRTFRFEMYSKLREDMVNRYSPTRGVNPPKFDIDFLHPSKLHDFYECDSYELKARGMRNPFATVYDKNQIYLAVLKYIFDELGFNVNQFDFNQMVSGIRVFGLSGENVKTTAMFTNHITCEINIEDRPIFQIDSRWYRVQDDFINNVNELCSKMIRDNYLRNGIIDELWGNNIEDEGQYNRLYHGKNNYWVFDKALGQNIELCDIMYEDDNSIYFIHVKTGFDAKIRDLSNQILISSSRFSNDRNSGSYEFLNAVIDSYNNNELNIDNLIERESFLNKFRTGGAEVIFVMAFKSELTNNVNVRGNISRIRSNIAKFSLIQCVKDMNTNNYPIKIAEIDRITSS